MLAMTVTARTAGDSNGDYSDNSNDNGGDDAGTDAGTYLMYSGCYICLKESTVHIGKYYSKYSGTHWFHRLISKKVVYK